MQSDSLVQQSSTVSGVFNNPRNLIDITENKGDDGTIVQDADALGGSIVMVRGTGKEFLHTGWFEAGTFNGNYSINLVNKIPWLVDVTGSQHKKVAIMEIYRRDPLTKEVTKKTQFHFNYSFNADVTGSPACYMEHGPGALGTEFIGLSPRYEYQFIGKSELDEGAGREAFYDVLYIDPIPRHAIVKASPEMWEGLGTEAVSMMEWGWMEVSTDAGGSGTGYVFPSLIDDDTWATNADHFRGYFNYIQSAHGSFRVDADSSCGLNINAVISSSRHEYTLSVGVVSSSAGSSTAWVYWTVEGYQLARQA